MFEENYSNEEHRKRKFCEVPKLPKICYSTCETSKISFSKTFQLCKGFVMKRVKIPLKASHSIFMDTNTNRRIYTGSFKNASSELLGRTSLSKSVYV